MVHNLPPTTVNCWIIKYKKITTTGVDTFYNSSGCLRAIDDAGWANIIKQLKDLRQQQNLSNRKRLFQETSQEQANKIRKWRGWAGNRVQLSRSAILRGKVINNIESSKCQFKISTRINAESDPRNLYSMACMCLAFCQ